MSEALVTTSVQPARSVVVRISSVALLPRHIDRTSIILIFSCRLDILPSIFSALRY